MIFGPDVFEIHVLFTIYNQKIKNVIDLVIRKNAMTKNLFDDIKSNPYKH